MKIEKKPFWKSKTKIAALLIGVGPVLATIGGVLNGSIDYATGITQLTASVGIIMGIFGVRDWKIINAG